MTSPVENPIRIGSVVNLQNSAGAHPYLDTRGRVQDKTQFKGSPERVFVSTYPSVNRHRGSGSWTVVSADTKTTGTPLSYGDRVHLLNNYPGAGYLDACSWAHEFAPFQAYPEAIGVFTHGRPDRDHGSGTWIVESATGKATGATVLDGDGLALRSAYQTAGYLHTVGKVQDNPTFAEYDGTDTFVFVGLHPTTGGDPVARTWRVSTSATHSSFAPDDDLLAGLIPMTDRTSTYQYTVQLGGAAISGDADVSMHFDTGSWDVCIPEKLVSSACTVVADAPVTTSWDLEAIRMKGDFTIRSFGRPKADGTGRTDVVEYVLKDFEFFKILDNDANKKAKSTINYREGIVGAFPSKSPYTTLPSLAYALAEKSRADDAERFGFGFVSVPPTNADGGTKGVADGWSTFESYLVVGAGPEILQRATWRSGIPVWRTGLDFCPEVVPGFAAEVRIPESDEKITSTDLIATIDTGAPDFTARLGKDDPHLKEPFAKHFTNVNGAPWWPQVDRYKDNARYLTDATVRITFTDDAGVTRFYTFGVGDTYASPATFVVAPWDSPVPWPIDTTQFPRNRANLGNTIYYYAALMYYDLGDKRVGFSFR